MTPQLHCFSLFAHTAESALALLDTPPSPDQLLRALICAVKQDRGVRLKHAVIIHDSLQVTLAEGVAEIELWLECTLRGYGQMLRLLHELRDPVPVAEVV